MPEIRYYEIDGRQIRYLTTDRPELPRVLFIHGAPGSLDAFSTYFELPQLTYQFELVSVDRPGYGYSGFGDSVTSLAEQARLLEPLLTDRTILVGHSYGGTIGVRLAIEYPERVAGLVLVAAAVDPENERTFFFNAPAEWRIVRWAVPKAWRVANREKVTHVAELTAMLPLWSRVRAPTVIMQGSRDRIVPVENARFAAAQLEGRVPVDLQILDGESHFILWGQRELIAQAIAELDQSRVDR